MTWAALVSAAVGAVLALSGSMLVEVRRDRQQRLRDRQTERRRSAVELTLALNAALGALRDVARAGAQPADRAAAVTRAFGDSGLYAAREHLLLSGTPALVAVAEDAFHRIVEVRNAVRSGEGLDSLAYHDAYHDYAESLWRFRLAVREDLGERGLTPANIRQHDWSDRERCRICGRDAAGPDDPGA
jgi:hypothetical protein